MDTLKSLTVTMGIVIVGSTLLAGCDGDTESPPEAEPAEAVEAEEPREEDQQEPAEQQPGAAAEPQPTPHGEDEEQWPGSLSEPQLSYISGGTVAVPVDMPESVRRETPDYPEAPCVGFDPDKLEGHYEELTEIDVVVPDGVIRLELRDIEGQTPGSDSIPGCWHVRRSEPVQQLEEIESSITFVAPPGVLSPDKRLSLPESRMVDDADIDDAVIRGVWSRFVDALGSGPRERVEQRMPELYEEGEPNEREIAEYVDAYDMGFPEPYRLLMVVNIPHGDNDCYSTGYLVDETGRIFEEVERRTQPPGCIEPEFVVELLGDGPKGMAYMYNATGPDEAKWLSLDDEGEPTTVQMSIRSGW